MRNRYVRGWPRAADGERAFVMPLASALMRTYRSDAHFAAYRSPNGRRLTREAIGRVDIELGAIVFDVDGPDHTATEAWRAELRLKVQALAVEHPEPLFYETRGGARIVYFPPEPAILRSHDDARLWSQRYAVAIAYLRRRFGITADAACSDWQRLYRLPRATRDYGGQPEDLPIWGEPSSIGVLRIRASDADIRAASRESKAFVVHRSRALSACPTNGKGLLFWLLHARNEVGDEAPRGGWIVLCPNRNKHSSNSNGSGSTVLYPPLAGESIGAIHCCHNHCRGIGVRGWLAFFSDTEIANARVAAGIVRRAA
jgi:hypothetical protein